MCSRKSSNRAILPPMGRAIAAAAGLLLIWSSTTSRATTACKPVEPVACPNCFAVFVMPDTQNYVFEPYQPRAGNHLDLVARYICAHRTKWTEPSTGKQMPILMTIHLGDLVQRADGSTPQPNLEEWKRIDAAFDVLDQCTPPVPYVVTVGNHDLALRSYESASRFYNEFFGVERWTERGYGCASLSQCDWDAGEWFLGGGDEIEALSRNQLGAGNPGPPTPQPGRHPAARIEPPNGQPFLFLGLELAFDFPPAPAALRQPQGNDAAWPLKVLSAHPDTPTILFHHSMLWAFPRPDDRLRWGPEIWLSDSIAAPGTPGPGRGFGETGGMEALYERLIEPFPQARFLFTGHVMRPRSQADYTIERESGGPVWAFLRNYQNRGVRKDPSIIYGAGWNVIAVFDPDAEEVRVRSYRIDDQATYATPPVDFDHAGQSVPTECFDMDEGGVGERVISWDFRVSPHRETPEE